jgi:hypothetical protein
MNVELEKDIEGSSCGQTELLSRILSGETKENDGRPQSG